MWFKKKAYIIGYNSNTAVDNTDWRTTGKSQSWFVSQTLPSAADAGNYFYLPTLGGHDGSGQLFNVGLSGSYWSSSAIPGGSITAYILYFTSGYVGVNNLGRRNGYRVDGFE